MRSTVKDWLKIFLLLLDEVAVGGLILLGLWFFGIGITLPVVIVIVLLVGLYAFISHKLIIPSFHKKKATGSEGMIGLEGEVIEPLTPVGVVRVKGEYWKAKSVAEDITAGEDVEVLRVDGLMLAVKPKNQ